MRAGVEEAIREALELESGRREGGEAPAAVVRWALVAEVLEPGDEEVSLSLVFSDNLTAWQAHGLARAIEKNADAGWIIEDDE